jgi:hypothetical protein
MANWCFNTVRFTGEPDKVKLIVYQFLSLRLKELETGNGQLPDFIEKETNYFFEISVKSGVLTFITRWIPPVEIMLEIAKHYTVDFEFDFEEIANGIYGKVIYKAGKATVFNLSAADFAAYSFDEEAGKYMFEEKYYDDNAEIFEMMLKRKMINVSL